ncbi:hypothetical protein KDA11_01820 [Candidatus Saccharibacteria bacterium]|nr:hypothetical protein [Candidatus Saccharibacteria bacterium]
MIRRRPGLIVADISAEAVVALKLDVIRICNGKTETYRPRLADTGIYYVVKGLGVIDVSNESRLKALCRPEFPQTVWEKLVEVDATFLKYVHPDDFNVGLLSHVNTTVTGFNYVSKNVARLCWANEEFAQIIGKCEAFYIAHALKTPEEALNYTKYANYSLTTDAIMGWCDHPNFEEIIKVFILREQTTWWCTDASAIAKKIRKTPTFVPFVKSYVAYCRTKGYLIVRFLDDVFTHGREDKEIIYSLIKEKVILREELPKEIQNTITANNIVIPEEITATEFSEILASLVQRLKN